MGKFPEKITPNAEMMWNAPMGRVIPVFVVTEVHAGEPVIVKDARSGKFALYNAEPGDLFIVCRWFLGCENPATHTQSHPILGDVPICDRCQSWYDRQN
jgi:hypothetical protein